MALFPTNSSGLFRIFFSLTLLCLASCHKDDEQKTPIPETVWEKVVVVYAIAENDLGLSNYASDSLELLAGCRYLNDNETLLLFVDNAYAPAIYQFTKNARKPQRVRTWRDDVCASSPDVLRDVLKWTTQYYPANEYGLVMWSHADGWLPAVNDGAANNSNSVRSFGIDVGEDGNMYSNVTANYQIGAQMNIADMADAIDMSGMHPKYIFFDACLMQNVETCYDLRHVTDYVIASPMAIPANGANYTSQMRKGLFSDRVEDIIDTYLYDVTDPLQAASYSDFGIVFSVVNTACMDELAEVVKQLLPLSTMMERTSVDLSDVLQYHAYSYYYKYRPHQYDMQQVMQTILPEEFLPRFTEALNKAVVARVATESIWVGPGDFTFQPVDLSNYCGVAMFVPQDVYTRHASQTEHGDLNQAFTQTAWYADAGWKATSW